MSTAKACLEGSTWNGAALYRRAALSLVGEEGAGTYDHDSSHRTATQEKRAGLIGCARRPAVHPRLRSVCAAHRAVAESAPRACSKGWGYWARITSAPAPRTARRQSQVYPRQKCLFSPVARVAVLCHENDPLRHSFDDRPPESVSSEPVARVGVFVPRKLPIAPFLHRLVPRKVRITPRGKGWGFCATKTPPQRHPPAAPTSKIAAQRTGRSAPVARVGVFWHGKPPARAPRNLRTIDSTPTRLSGRSAPMARVGGFVIQKPLQYLSARRSCVRHAADRLTSWSRLAMPRRLRDCERPRPASRIS
jgi:hypothetical protein